MSGIHAWTRLVDKGCTVKAQTCSGPTHRQTHWPVPGADESWQPVENRGSKTFNAAIPDMLK